VVESVLEEMSENSCLSNATVATLLEELEVPVPSSLFKDLSQSAAVLPTGCRFPPFFLYASESR
jgi:hypothetical protein